MFVGKFYEIFQIFSVYPILQKMWRYSIGHFMLASILPFVNLNLEKATKVFLVTQAPTRFQSWTRCAGTVIM